MSPSEGSLTIIFRAPSVSIYSGADLLTSVIAPTSGALTSDLLTPSQPRHFGLPSHSPKPPLGHNQGAALHHAPSLSLQNHGHYQAKHSPSNAVPSLYKTPKTILSPPTSSILDGPAHRHYLGGALANVSSSSITNQQQGYLRSEHPSEISLTSDRGARFRYFTCIQLG